MTTEEAHISKTNTTSWFSFNSRIFRYPGYPVSWKAKPMGCLHSPLYHKVWLLSASAYTSLEGMNLQELFDKCMRLIIEYTIKLNSYTVNLLQ